MKLELKPITFALRLPVSVSGKAKNALIAAPLVMASAMSQAFELNTDNPDLTVRWDNTIKYNLTVRAEKIDKKIEKLEKKKEKIKKK